MRTIILEVHYSRILRCQSHSLYFNFLVTHSSEKQKIFLKAFQLNNNK